MNHTAVSNGVGAKDPVCGMTVDPQSASHKTEYRGKTYHFCCEHCLEKFQSNPEGYLEGKKEEPPAQTGAVYTCPMDPEIRQDKPGACPKCGMALESATAAPLSRTEYVCPMHPEVVRDQPGACPKCGMALEPRTVEASEGENPELRYMKKRFWIALALAIPVFVSAMEDLIPGRPLEQLASRHTWIFIEMRMEINRQPQSEHVHLDRTGRRSGLHLQPDCRPDAANLPRIVSG